MNDPREGVALLNAADADDEERGRSVMGPFVRLALATGPKGAGG